ncbi:mechanosensitive ion channel family protein [Thiothrix lacustris]|uniref:mechanosensitive ion channel family protein n=1 Tax=Thiothrix lacustris TaxID=525917 RepID=UPI0027E50A59|nr:mechanosensitive ion channel family protein [Thiothrix lacustris]WMP19444.1 mechanosensitive ion channel family protein [Thiothrix lacustris]
MFETIQQWLQPYLETATPYLDETWGLFSDYTYLQAAFVAALGYVIGRLLGRYLPEMLRSGLERVNLRISNDILNLSRFPLFNLTFMGSLLLAVHISGLTPAVIFVLQNILKSTMLAVIGIFAYQLAKLLLNHIAYSGDKRGIIQPQTLPLFTNAAMVFVLVGAAQQVFAVWHVDMTALLASAGIAGLAIGMASKDMLADVIAGILILTDNPYRLDDIIWTNDRSVKGKVTRIGIRSTRILTKDNLEIIVPNSLMGKSRIMNESSAPDSGFRCKLEIMTASGVDSEHIRALVLDVSNNSKDVDQNKPQIVQLLRFNQDVATFRLLFWVADTDKQASITHKLREALYKRFLQEKIPLAAIPSQEIAITHLPDSHQDISIKEMPDSNRTIYVKEIPNLFASKPAQSAVKLKKEPAA